MNDEKIALKLRFRFSIRMYSFVRFDFLCFTSNNKDDLIFFVDLYNFFTSFTSG